MGGGGVGVGYIPEQTISDKAKTSNVIRVFTLGAHGKFGNLLYNFKILGQYSLIASSITFNMIWGLGSTA